MSKTSFQDVVAAIEKTNNLSKVVEQHEEVLERLIDRLKELEARVQALEGEAAKPASDG